MGKKYKLLGQTYDDKGEETKLARIDAILKQNPSHDYKGTYIKGMKELGKAQPKKVQAILRATNDLEKKFKCKIKWSKMEWNLVITQLRRNFGVSGIGSNVIIHGKSDKGENVRYKYSQPPSAESGSRSYQYGSKRGTNSDFT